MASPARVVRQILVNLGLVLMPAVSGQTIPYRQFPGDGTTLCYTGSLPDELDQAILIANTAGVVSGRESRTGRTLEHLGIRITVRTLNQEESNRLARKLWNGLKDINRISIVVEEETHYVQSIYRVGTITDLGEELGKKRFLTVINARMAFQDQDSTQG